MLQLQLLAAYALTIHKVQALTMAGKVLGCLEGIFAHGQIYVLVSRVTDPRNLCLIGLPSADLLDDIAAAWAAQGLDVDACLATAAITATDTSPSATVTVTSSGAVTARSAPPRARSP